MNWGGRCWEETLVNYSNPKPLNVAPKKKLSVAGGF